MHQVRHRIPLGLYGDGRTLRTMVQRMDKQVTKHDLAFLEIENHLVDPVVHIQHHFHTSLSSLTLEVSEVFLDPFVEGMG